MSACGGKKGSNNSSGEDLGPAKKYTYHAWAEALGTKWDPNTWETGEDSTMLGYVTEGMVGIAPLSTEQASWQWTYDLAVKVEDVSDKVDAAEYAKYHVANSTPAAGEKLQGLVYDIELNPNAKWEKKTVNGKEYGGTVINADDYVESMKILLDPARKNYRANLYYGGESAVAGGNQYYNNDVQRVYSKSDVADAAAAVALNATNPVYLDIWDFWQCEEGYTDADGNACPQYLTIDDEHVYANESHWTAPDAENDDVFSCKEVFDAYGGPYFDYMNLYTAEDNWGFGKSYEECVGFQKVGDFKIRYFLQTALDVNYFMTSLTSSWLVHPQLYKDLTEVDAATGATISKYNTSAETTISYGPYKLVSFEAGKQAKFTQNEYWYGWEKQSNGALLSYTNFLVDGKKQQQYQTTDIVIDVMTQAAAKLAFLKGELNDYNPLPEELFDYTQSSQLYQVDDTYTWSFFFNTNEETLQNLDAAANNNQNSIVLSNFKFRKAMSLAFNRAEFVKNTGGWKPAYSLMNSLYYYDIYNDPTSQYRKTDAAMKAIVDLYGIEYGEDKVYKTLKEAYDSVSGYNLAEAKALFKEACDELVAAGKYVAGQDIKIRMAYKKGTLDATDNAQVTELNKELNAALEGSGFGSIELIAVGDLPDRHHLVYETGDYAIGFGAWGGAAFYPFRNMQVYMDPDSNKINEAACWDPKTETLTLNIKGADVTRTYQQWSNALTGDGEFANEEAQVKLEILAALENAFLGFYYRIPLAAETSCFLLGYQQHYYTQEYNIMYDFGGFRLMIYDYDDIAWNAYVSSQGGNLNYK